MSSPSWIRTFNKKAISKIIHLSGNTYVDVGRVHLDSGGLIKINDERVIYTGKSSIPTPRANILQYSIIILKKEMECLDV